MSIKLLNNRKCKTMNRIIASTQLTISLFLFIVLPADFVHDNDNDDDATHVNPKCQGAEYRGAASVCRVSRGGYFYKSHLVRQMWENKALLGQNESFSFSSVKANNLGSLMTFNYISPGNFRNMRSCGE